MAVIFLYERDSNIHWLVVQTFNIIITEAFTGQTVTLPLKAQDFYAVTLLQLAPTLSAIYKWCRVSTQPQTPWQNLLSLGNHITAR